MDIDACLGPRKQILVVMLKRLPAESLRRT